MEDFCCLMWLTFASLPIFVKAVSCLAFVCDSIHTNTDGHNAQTFSRVYLYSDTFQQMSYTANSSKNMKH